MKEEKNTFLVIHNKKTYLFHRGNSQDHHSSPYIHKHASNLKSFHFNPRYLRFTTHHVPEDKIDFNWLKETVGEKLLQLNLLEKYTPPEEFTLYNSDTNSPSILDDNNPPSNVIIETRYRSNGKVKCDKSTMENKETDSIEEYKFKAFNCQRIKRNDTVFRVEDYAYTSWSVRLNKIPKKK